MTERLPKQVREKLLPWWDYVSTGVWHDTRQNWYVDLVKILNLSVRSFFNRDLQSRACALSFRTLLAIVPALALVFAIGRGFGLQDLIQEQLYLHLPAQRDAIDMAMVFINSCLDNSANGMFLGIGIIFLLWTMITMMSNIERSFNLIWGVKGRSIGRKVTDYIAMLLILPVVMICAGGFTLALSSTLQNIFAYPSMTPVIKMLVELSSWIFTWLFFTLVYLLLPNTKVKFKNALFSGIFAGTGFIILQWIFVSGQMFVSNYNAIYGSVSFLPLLLIWMQFTYVITFAGAVVCYSSQNIFMYSFNDAIENISNGYQRKLIVAVSAIVVQRFTANKGATSIESLILDYNIPPRLASIICDKLVSAGVFSVVEINPKNDIKGYQPAINPECLTLGEVYKRVDKLGADNFVKGFDKIFPEIDNLSNEMQLTQIKITITT